VEALTDSPWFDLIASVVMLASAIAAVTPTPQEGSILAKLYRLIDWAALNVGKAKDKGAG